MVDYSHWDNLASDDELESPPTSKNASSATPCWTCGAAEAAMLCGRCRQAWFCGRRCQRDGWRRHKFQCRAPEDTAAAASKAREVNGYFEKQLRQEGVEELRSGEAPKDLSNFVRPPMWPDCDMGLAVIIPFKQQPLLQDRGRHLELLVSCLQKALERLVAEGWMRRWKILVVEQLERDRPCNRGALLNAGFRFLEDSGERFEQVVLHDADLLPGSRQCEVWYAAKPPSGHVLHLSATGYKKYEGAKKLDATAPGVALLRWEDFRRSNGFPNDVWGWAARLEDMVWFQRLGEQDMCYYPCPVGDWRDLDELDLSTATLERPEMAYEERWLLCRSPELQRLRRGSRKEQEELERWLMDRRGGLDSPDFFRVVRQGPCLKHATLIEVMLLS